MNRIDTIIPFASSNFICILNGDMLINPDTEMWEHLDYKLNVKMEYPEGR